MLVVLVQTEVVARIESRGAPVLLSGVVASGRDRLDAKRNHHPLFTKRQGQNKNEHLVIRFNSAICN